MAKGKKTLTKSHKCGIMETKKGRERKMHGISMEHPILYKHASLRFFEKNERHVNRFCRDDVLLLVYEGTLRFSEDGESVEVGAGEYYIQRKNRTHEGDRVSDAPKYLYVHMDAVWCEEGSLLPVRGRFDYAELAGLMGRLDAASHEGQPYTACEYLLLKLILSLKRREERKDTAGARIAAYIEAHLKDISSLADLCDEFHYSKNYIIRIFNREFGVSPVRYINDARIERAKYLLETTSESIGEILDACGYLDYAYFYKCFVRRCGVSPAKWRKQVQENPIFE